MSQPRLTEQAEADLDELCAQGMIPFPGTLREGCATRVSYRKAATFRKSPPSADLAGKPSQSSRTVA